MKGAFTLLLILFAGVQLATAQNAVRFDGLYECKEWKSENANPSPAYFRFYPNMVLLLANYKNAGDKDSSTAQDVFRNVLSESTLETIKENMAEDSTNVYKNVGKFKVTAYKYEKIKGGICFDILSERTNCLGKPNMKVTGDAIKTENGDPAADRYFKFIPSY